MAAIALPPGNGLRPSLRTKKPRERGAFRETMLRESQRRPVSLRAMTRRWISLVPS